MVTKKYESYKEQRQRMNYATELIEERETVTGTAKSDFARIIISSQIQ